MNPTIKTYSTKFAENKFFILILLVFFIFSICYMPLTQPLKGTYMHHLAQAEAFLNLKLDINNQYDLWELVIYNGKYFNIFPPGPTLFVMPLFAIFGYDLNFQIFMQVVALLCIILIYNLMYKLTNNKNISLILTIAFVFGTVFFWVANQLGVWFTNQMFSLLFILLLLNECFGKKRGALMGLYLGFAFISRQVTIFYIVFAIAIIVNKYWPTQDKSIKKHLAAIIRLIKEKSFLKDMLAVIGVSGIFVALYMILNYMKFGSPIFAGYEKIIDQSLFGLKYVPWNFYLYFVQPPYFKDTFPFLFPPGRGQAIIFTTPLLLLVFHKKIKKEILIPIWTTILLIFAIHMIHQGSGGAQFGTRYILDYIPLLFCLLAYRYKDKIDVKFTVLTCLSIFLCVSGTLLLKIYWNQ